MKMKSHPVVAGVALLALSAILFAGCGGDDDSGTTTTTATAAAGGGTIEIEMGDFYFDPKNATATAGEATIKAPNVGSVEHELVLFKSDDNPADLPTEANGEVDEEKLEGSAEEIGEIADVEPGKTGSAKFNLTPGKYVMFCNLPGHYAQGMYGSLTVSK